MQGFAENFFELFGFPVAYPVSRELLGERYRELQHLLHPDRFATAGDLERRLAMQRAALINQAYQVLGDPIARANYLLGLYGVDTSSRDGAPRVDTDFLLEQMELREALENARQAADPHLAIGRLRDRIQADINRFIREMEGYMEHVVPADPERARMLIDKMQYLHKLGQNAERIEAALDHL